jgi:ribosome biogenesis protein Tsr3
MSNGKRYTDDGEPCNSSEVIERREAIVVEALARGETQREALIAAGYAETTISQQGRTIVERALRNSPMAEALEAAGATREKLATRLAEGLDASLPIMYTKDGTQYGGGADFAHRLKYIETVIKLRGEDAGKVTTETGETHEARVLRLRGLAPVLEP